MLNQKFNELSSLSAIKEASEIAKFLPTIANAWTDDNNFLCQDLQNEIAELLHEVNQGQNNKQRIFEELGDVMFVLCRIANLFNVDVETATKYSVEELKRRFLYLEEKYGANKIKTASQDEFFKFWKEAKNNKNNK